MLESFFILVLVWPLCKKKLIIQRLFMHASFLSHTSSIWITKRLLTKKGAFSNVDWNLANSKSEIVKDNNLMETCFCSPWYYMIYMSPVYLIYLSYKHVRKSRSYICLSSDIFIYWQYWASYRIFVAFVLEVQKEALCD